MRKDVPACDPGACAGTMTRIAFGGLTRVEHLAVPAPDVVFVMQGNGAVMRVAVKLGTVQHVTSTTDYPGLVAGEGEVFATSGKQTAVVRIPAAGTPVRTLGSLVAVEIATKTPVQLDTGSVWRIDVTDGAIAFGQHGAKPTDATAGAIFLIEK